MFARVANGHVDASDILVGDYIARILRQEAGKDDLCLPFTAQSGRQTATSDRQPTPSARAQPTPSPRPQPTPSSRPQQTPSLRPQPMPAQTPASAVPYPVVAKVENKKGKRNQSATIATSTPSAVLSASPGTALGQDSVDGAVCEEQRAAAREMKSLSSSGPSSSLAATAPVCTVIRRARKSSRNPSATSPSLSVSSDGFSINRSDSLKALAISCAEASPMGPAIPVTVAASSPLDIGQPSRGVDKSQPLAAPGSSPRLTFSKDFLHDQARKLPKPSRPPNTKASDDKGGGKLHGAGASIVKGSHSSAPRPSHTNTVLSPASSGFDIFPLSSSESHPPPSLSDAKPPPTTLAQTATDLPSASATTTVHQPFAVPCQPFAYQPFAEPAVNAPTSFPSVPHSGLSPGFSSTHNVSGISFIQGAPFSMVGHPLYHSHARTSPFHNFLGAPALNNSSNTLPLNLQGGEARTYAHSSVPVHQARPQNGQGSSTS